MQLLLLTFNPLRAKISKVKETLITFQFHSLVVSLSDMHERGFMSRMPVTWHLKG